MTAQRKALLLRVGIDRGTGGMLSPIFADGSFEYVPIPEAEPTRSFATFAMLQSPRGRSPASFVPRRLLGRPAHVDPDFAHLTYGDAAPHKRRQLLRLEPGDFLVFYSGFAPWPEEDIPRLFAIGWFAVKHVHHLMAQQIATDRKLRRRFGVTAHFLRDPPDPDLALVEGDSRHSRLLGRALPLGDGEDRLLPDLAAFGYRGSLRRAVGHWLGGQGMVALAGWLHCGPASLIDQRTRLFAVPAASLQPAAPGQRRGDLIVADAQAAAGDWVFVREAGNFALARVNATNGTQAEASLYWHLRGLAPAAFEKVPCPDARNLPHPGAATLRRLVSRVASRYRMGMHPG